MGSVGNRGKYSELKFSEKQIVNAARGRNEGGDDSVLFYALFFSYIPK